MADNWLERHKQQTARLTEIVMPVFVANRQRILKVADEAEKIGSPRLKIKIKLLRERLKNRGDFGIYNACVELTNFHMDLKENPKTELHALANALPLTEIREKVEEYRVEAGIADDYTIQDFDIEKLAAKKTYGSEMMGIEHLWGKAVMQVLAEIK